MVILITGKKGAGKSHYARMLSLELREETYLVRWIDGDSFRRQTGNQDFSDEGRERNLMEAAKIASHYEDRGFIVLMSFIMPKKKWRYKMRKLFEESRIVYLPGGELWKGTEYERPTEREMKIMYNYKRFMSWEEL